MTPGAFGYARPGSLDDAVALLADHGSAARILSGGQSLIPLLAQRAVRPSLVIDINRLEGLDRIEPDGDRIRMGALVRQEQARVSPLIRAAVSGLSAALDWVANPVIRERGTVIGNLVANAPGAELPAVALAWSAWFVVRDAHGERQVPAAQLLGPGGGPGPQAMVTHVLWPRSAAASGFYEVARRDGHAPVVGALVSYGERSCRVGLCGVAAVGIACASVARALARGWPDLPAVADLDRALVEDLGAADFGDEFVPAAYRREVAAVVIRRAAAAARTAGR